MAVMMLMMGLRILCIMPWKRRSGHGLQRRRKCRKCRIDTGMYRSRTTQEQLSSNFLRLDMRRSCASLRSQHTTTRDGGSAENAGAIFCPSIPGHKETRQRRVSVRKNLTSASYRHLPDPIRFGAVDAGLRRNNASVGFPCVNVIVQLMRLDLHRVLLLLRSSFQSLLPFQTGFPRPPHAIRRNRVSVLLQSWQPPIQLH